MTVKDEIVVDLAKTLREFMRLSGLDWDSAYFRFLDNGGGGRKECLHVSARELRIASPSSRAEFKIDADFADKYFDELADLFLKLHAEFEKEGINKPAVVVLKVTKAGEYQIDFDHDDPYALQIGKMYLGKPNSYFKPGEIDIPDHILDFQNELGKVTRDES